jgi:antitoxin (DNA-binding transcriptional repressor) of toxin-antitoxin stability system
MKKIGIYEAKTHFSRLIADVKMGAEVVIHDRGVPVAKLVRVSADEGAGDDLVKAFRELRASAGKVSQAEVGEWIRTGRK